MNDLGTILLHLDASPRLEERIRFAETLASRIGGDSGPPVPIDAFYAVDPLFQPFVFSEGSAGVLDLLQDQDAQRRRQVRAILDRTAHAARPAIAWHESEGEAAIDALTRRALWADLLVLGQHDPGSERTPGVPADFVESVLIHTGKPGIVLPYTGSFATAGDRMLLAWKPNRETARALAASIPFLRRCQTLHIVAERGEGETILRSGLLHRYLQSHGIDVRIQQHAALDTHAAGESLLSLAADVDADLLVMGCYGHSRTRELVLGGVTRTVLTSMTLPVLMAH